MKKIIALSSIFILLCSCSSDYNDDLVPIVLVKKIITKNMNDNSVINITEFEYDGNKISKSFGQNNILSYTYTGDLITNIKIYDLNNTLMFEYLYSYENNNLVESTYKMLLNNVCEKRLYTYNTNQTVDLIYYKGDLITQNTLYKTGIITIQNEEVVSVVVQDHINSINRNSTYIYDNHNNPNKNVVGFNKLNVELDRVGGTFQNPISNTNNYNNSVVMTDYTYVYNSTSFPITSTLNNNSGINYKFEYFY
jgi:hypothetical protein